MTEPAHHDEGGEALHHVQLGDALGDDAALFRSLIKIDETVNSEAPGTAGHHLWDLMALAKMVWPKVTACARVIWDGVLRFTGEETKRIVAESEAKEREIIAGARAEKIRAEAEKNKAEAAQLTAVAEETRAQTRRKDELLKKLNSRVVDWHAELDEEGRPLRIVVTKRSLSDQG